MEKLQNRLRFDRLSQI